MNILGISCFYHDSAAALLVDGAIIAAAQEERFSRKKHDARFPGAAIRYCLGESGLSGSAIDHVVFYEKPFLKFERLVENYLAVAPAGFAQFRYSMQTWLGGKLFQKRDLIRSLQSVDLGFNAATSLQFSEHHLSHAASAFFPSPFDRAAVLCVDGVGEYATTSAWEGRPDGLRLLREINFPHSLGLLYSAMTHYCGFRVNSGEYKLMGLAPYGRPVYAQTILDHLVDLRDDGSYALNLDYFGYRKGLEMTNARFHALFGGEPRQPNEPLAQRHMDLAASIQAVLEEAILRITRWLARKTGATALCLAGGVALNCVANSRIVADGAFERVFIQPAAGDAGGALGAALALHHTLAGAAPRRADAVIDTMAGSYLGPAYGDDAILAALEEAGAVYDRLGDDELIEDVAQALAAGSTTGWVQGRMEFGPRALGNRSILADPRRADMQRVLNLKIKFRESFRPFAPSVLAEQAEEWFEGDDFSAYMLLVNHLKSERRRPPQDDAGRTGLDLLHQRRSVVPAITHVDYSARVQVVHHATNTLYHALISRFAALTGCPMLVNTSFNVRGEPIVCTPADAYRCFMATDLDLLAIGNFLLHKERQPGDRHAYPRQVFEAD
jgi:carbamoyltransferase